MFNEISPAGSLDLWWYREDPAYTFRIYQANTENGAYSLIATVSGETSGACNHYQVDGLTTGQTYWFYITAVSADGIESPPSQQQAMKVL